MKSLVFIVALAFVCACNQKAEDTSVKSKTEVKDSVKVEKTEVKKVEPKKEEPKVVEEVKQEEPKVAMEKCYCCGDLYEKGQGYFYYKEAGHWYCYEQRQDLLGVAIGQYSCSRRCAKECPVRPISSYY
jgi:hypothetical protein